jgi:hypothetical protein
LYGERQRHYYENNGSDRYTCSVVVESYFSDPSDQLCQPHFTGCVYNKEQTCRIVFLPPALEEVVTPSQNRSSKTANETASLWFLVEVCLLLAAADASAVVRYVDVNSANPTPPYADWSTAATDIQDAVDAALAGEEVVVTNGVYRTGGKAAGFINSRVAIDKPLTVHSVNGSQFTTIEGTFGTRCTLIQNGAFLAGFTLTNGNVGSSSGSGGGGGVFFGDAPTDAVVSNCVIIGCIAVAGGGAASADTFGSPPGSSGGTFVNCTFANNRATGVPGFPVIQLADGGAVHSCRLINCTLTNNGISLDSPYGGAGGGAYKSILLNCLLVGNSSSIPWAQGSGGGAAFSSLVNCTVVQNTGGLGGGVYRCSVTNSIVYANSGDNHASNNFVAYSCTTPMPEDGTGNITNAPLFADSANGNFRLQLGSPCIDAGNNSYVATLIDLDGSRRFVGYFVDMGAYELWPTHYVSLNSPNPTPPYLSWSTAATNIQDAVDTAGYDHRVLVTNGVYQTGGRFVFSGIGYGFNRLWVSQAVRVESVNGPEVTSIFGYQVPGTTNGTGAVRCAYLSSGAILTGFTLTNGATEFGTSGGGVSCESLSEVLSNCIVAGNSADWSGGGSFRGTIQNCTLKGNSTFGSGGAGRGGGAHSGTLNDCVLTQNSATDYGGGAYGTPTEPLFPCTLNNCIISGNRAIEGYGGGTYGATLINCTVITNKAYIEGGGAWSGTFRNCILIGNEAGDGGGVAGGSVGISRSFLYNCTLAGNRTTGGLPGHDGAATKNSWLRSCIVSQNYGQHGWGPNYAASCTLNYCCTSPMPPGIGNIAYDPLFVDPANANFRLQSNSPCINSGLGAYTEIDLDGNPRVVGGASDIGAYEFQSPSSVLSYAWAQQYGLPTDGSADYADADGDLMNNWQEWIAGTVPTNALSLLRLLNPATNSLGLAVSWQSVTNRTYFLERASSLGTQPSFSLLAGNIIGQPGTTSYTDTNVSGPFFYRVGVQR